MMYNGQIIVSILVIDSEPTTFSLILSVFPLVDTPLRSDLNTRNPPRVVGINTRGAKEAWDAAGAREDSAVIREATSTGIRTASQQIPNHGADAVPELKCPKANALYTEQSNMDSQLRMPHERASWEEGTSFGL